MKVAIIVHVFYPDFWPELAECIRAIDAEKEIVLTCTDAAAVATAKRDFPDARVIVCENRGFDVWPFIKALSTLDLDRYDCVVKLHTKRDINYECKFNGEDFGGSHWRDCLLSFCRTREAWRQTAARLAKRSVGMVADVRTILRRKDVGRGDAEAAFDRALEEIARLGGATVGKRDRRYVAGTMFAVKIAPLKLLLKRGWSVDDFAASSHADDLKYQLAHVAERMLGLAVGACGMQIAPATGSIFWHHTLVSWRRRLKRWKV